MSKYKVGNFVTFHELYDIEDSSRLTADGDHAYNTCDVTAEMWELLSEWEDNQIDSIDEDGDFKFSDFPFTWPIEVIRGLSEDQRDYDN